MTPFDTLVDAIQALEAGTHRLDILAARRAVLAKAFDATIADIDAAHMGGRSAAAQARHANRLDCLIDRIDQRSLAIVSELRARLKGSGHAA